MIICKAGCLSQKSQEMFSFLPVPKFPISFPQLFWTITNQNKHALFTQWMKVIKSITLHVAYSYVLLVATLIFFLLQLLSLRLRTLFQSLPTASHERLVNLIHYFVNIFCDKHPALIIAWLQSLINIYY